MNIFEGARRMAMVIYVGMFATGVGAAWNDDPYVGVNYSVKNFLSSPVWVDACGEHDGYEYLKREIKHGRMASVTLCFAATKSDDNRDLIPYEITKDGVWMSERTSNKVSEYTKSIASKFRIPKDDVAPLNEIWVSKRRSSAMEIAGATALCILGAWIFFAGIGWIVRGFMGIPRGRDDRH